MVQCNVFLALALSVGALAGAAPPRAQCVTKLGTSSVKYPLTQTSTKTQTITRTKIIVKKIDKTITPNPKTVSVSETAFSTSTVTASQNTDTATVTITNTATNTDTLYITETKTKTQTITSTSTSTFTSVPPGFTPIASYLASLNAPVPRAHAALEERKTSKGSKGSSVKCDKNGKPVRNTPQYPQAVNCVKTISKTAVKTLTSTTRGTVTLPKSTYVKTVTVTSTVTDTVVPPNAETTETTTTDRIITVTAQRTITDYTTATATIPEVAVETINGACLASNLGEKDNNGKYFIGLASGTLPGLSFLSGAASGFDCCMACQNTPFCTGSAWIVGSCYATVDTVCRPGEAVTGVWIIDGSVNSQSSGVIVSNGPCGLLHG